MHTLPRLPKVCQCSALRFRQASRLSRASVCNSDPYSGILELSFVQVLTLRLRNPYRCVFHENVSTRWLGVRSTLFALILGSRGVRVNAVAPGVVETDMTSFAKTDAGRDSIFATKAL